MKLSKRINSSQLQQYNRQTFLNRITPVVAVSVLAAAVSFPAVSSAQDDASAEENTLEEVIVTGSHIRRDTFTSSSPIATFTSQEIEGIGASNVGDLMARLPSITASVDGSSVNVNVPQDSGISTTALRNLGSSRTLVLVNGRRYVSGTSAGSGYGVDLNTLPTTMIERIEVLTGGQSAAYGSDAVAGVVNIITRTDFEGVALNAQVSQASEGDREQQHIDLTVGHNFDAGNTWFSFGYSNDEGLLSADRKFAKVSQRSIDTDGDGLYDSLAFEGSSFIPGTRLIGGGLSIKGDGSPFDGGRDRATSDRLNFNEFRSLLIPLESTFAAGGLTLDLGENTRATMGMNYARVESRARFEPIPYSVVNDAFRVNRGGTTGIDLTTHPLWVGSSAGSQLVAAGVTSLDNVLTFRRTVELGDRGSGNERTTFRVVAALEHEFDNGLYLDTYATYGVTDQVQTDFGDINLERAAIALDIEPDGFGGYQCASELARIQGCVPYNPFNTLDSIGGQAGITGFSPEAVDYLAAGVGLEGEVEQIVVSSVLSGSTGFAIGDQSDASFAVGLEYREEKGEETPDGLRQKGITRGYNIQPTKGSFDVIDVFGEIQLPIFDQLTLDAAFRWGDYSSVGSTTTWKLGLDAPISESVRLRASASTAVRAPNISDLYAGAVANAILVFDPCNGVDASSSGNTAENCRSIPAIQNRIDAFGSFTLTQVESQNTTSYNTGSPTVEEEDADSYTMGAVFTPEGLENLLIAVDYYDIEIKDAIRIPTGTNILERCHDVSPGSFDPTCGGLVFRDPNLGPALDVLAVANNEDTIKTSGIDFEASYVFNDVGPGDLLVSFFANYLNEYEVVGIAGDKQELDGEVLFPETRFNLNFDYTAGDFNVFSQVRYRSSTKDRNDNTVHNNNLNNFDSVWYVDLRGSYRINETLNVYIGANNLFDETPPLMGFTHKYLQQGVNTNGTAFDTVGRQIYAGVNLTF